MNDFDDGIEFANTETVFILESLLQIEDFDQLKQYLQVWLASAKS